MRCGKLKTYKLSESLDILDILAAGPSVTFDMSETFLS